MLHKMESEKRKLAELRRRLKETEEKRNRAEEREQARQRLYNLRQRRARDLRSKYLTKLTNKFLKKNWTKQFGIVNPFLMTITPENCVALGVPNYFDYVKRGIGFQEIKEKLKCGEYYDLKLYADDVRLLISNAKAYNREGSPGYRMAMWIERTFNKDFPVES